MLKVSQVKADQPNQQLRTSLYAVIEGSYKLFSVFSELKNTSLVKK